MASKWPLTCPSGGRWHSAPDNGCFSATSARFSAEICQHTEASKTFAGREASSCRKHTASQSQVCYFNEPLNVKRMFSSGFSTSPRSSLCNPREKDLAVLAHRLHKKTWGMGVKANQAHVKTDKSLAWENGKDHLIKVRICTRSLTFSRHCSRI